MFYLLLFAYLKSVSSQCQQICDSQKKQPDKGRETMHLQQLQLRLEIINFQTNLKNTLKLQDKDFLR